MQRIYLHKYDSTKNHKNMIISNVTEILNSKGIDFKVNDNPSPSKISFIRQTLERKQSMMNIAVSAYKNITRR